MDLFTSYCVFFGSVFTTLLAFPITNIQSNFSIIVQKGYSGVFGNETIDVNVGECYQLPEHKIPSVIHLNGTTSISPNYTFYGFSTNDCDINVVTKPLKPNASFFLNERNSICSFSLGKPLPPTFEVTIDFTHESAHYYVTTNNTNCSDICNDEESKHYPSTLGIYEKDGYIANNFVRLYSEPDCLIDSIILNRNGSEEIKTGEDLFDISLMEPISVVRSFIVTTNM